MDPDFKLFLAGGGISEEMYEAMNPSDKAGLFIAFNASKRSAPAPGINHIRWDVIPNSSTDVLHFSSFSCIRRSCSCCMCF